jgi:HlyD family secretion protein
MRTRICLAIGLVVGLWTLGVGSLPAGGAEPPSPPRRAGGYAGMTANQAAQLQKRIDSTVREAGVVQSADTLELRSQIEGSTTILHIVPDGSAVKKGDLLVELDASSLRDAQLKQEVAAAEARGALQQAETTRSALSEAGKGRLAVAELALKVAELDQQRFQGEGGELELEMRKADSHLAVAEQRLNVAELTFEHVEKAVEDGRADKRNLEEARLAVVESRAQLETAQASRQFLTGHARDYRAAALQLAVAQAKATLSQIKTESIVALQKAQAEAVARKTAFQLEEGRLKRIQQQMENCCIVAPRDGIVVYANVAAARRTDPGAVIGQGATVRQRQPILTMPDMTRLRVRATVHESRVDRVRKGQPAEIRVDAFPDRVFRGTVAEISDTPEPTSWFNSQVKQYAVVVSIEDPPPQLRLGMTALVEIDVSASDRD